jgi:23S rRNA pseudouridine2605 synthase
MRQNGHGAITIEDVRTWIEETGLCIFLPRSAQAGFTAPTFVEAIAGQRTTEPTLELITTAEALLVRLEAEGVAVRLNLAGQPLSNTGDQPDYVVASWVLPYIYALRGDRDWRRSPQLTGSRQVSQLAVYTAKHLDSANLNAGQLRDALGKEVTETAVLRALHELWKQLRVIPVVPELGVPALWQPLRQRFQKAIAEGASTSQVTAISVLASIYLQAVIAASMEDVEMFLSPLTSRSKIREVVRGLAATRQVHTTTMGHSPMFYVAGTLPEFPAVPSFQISGSYPPYRGSSYLGTDPDQSHDDEFTEPVAKVYDLTPKPLVSSYAMNHASSEVSANGASNGHSSNGHSGNDHSQDLHSLAAKADEAEIVAPFVERSPERAVELSEKEAKALRRKQPLVSRPAARPAPRQTAPAPVSKSAAKPAAPRPRTAGPVNPRDQRSRTVVSSDGRPGASRSGTTRSGTSRSGASANGVRHRAPAPRTASGNGNGVGNGVRHNANAAKNGAAPARGRSISNGNGHHGATAKPNGNNARNGKTASGSARPATRTSANRHAANGRPASRPANGSSARPASFRSASGNGVKSGTSNGGRGNGGHSNGHSANGHTGASPAKHGVAKHSAASRGAGKHVAGKPVTTAARNGKSNGNSASNGSRKPATASAAKRYSFTGQAKQAPKPAASRAKVAAAKPAARPAAKRPTAVAVSSARSSAKPAQAKRRG